MLQTEKTLLRYRRVRKWSQGAAVTMVREPSSQWSEIVYLRLAVGSLLNKPGPRAKFAPVEPLENLVDQCRIQRELAV